MNVKENRHGDPDILGKYLVNKGDNDAVPEIFCNVGTTYTGLTKKDVKAAINEMGALATAKSSFFAQHLQLSPDSLSGHKMTAKDIQFAIDTTLEQRGWKNDNTVRPHVATIHRKDGRMHIHLAVQSFNPGTGRMDPAKPWARDHAVIREKVETSLGHPRTRKANPNHATIKERMTALWHGFKTGSGFVQAAMKEGYVIAWGGRKRPLQVVEPEGISHDLVRKIDGARTADVYEKLKAESLPLAKDAIRANREKSEARKRAEKKRVIEEQKDYSPDSRTKPEVVEFDISKKQHAFQEALRRFKEAEALKEEQRRVQEERERKVKEMRDQLDEVFARKKKRGLSL